MELAIRSGKRIAGVAVVLMLLAVPLYKKSLQRSKETLLANERFAVRVAMDEYTFDKQKAPRTMQDLVDAGYLRSVPLDHFSGIPIR